MPKNLKSNPDKTWQLQEAKAKFSEVVENALQKGPQRVTRRGKESVIVISETDYWGVRKRPTLLETLRKSPFVLDPVDLDWSRSKEDSRNIEL